MKVCKRALQGLVKNWTGLTDLQFMSALIAAENLVNKRPICLMEGDDDPEDAKEVVPADFLTHGKLCLGDDPRSYGERGSEREFRLKVNQGMDELWKRLKYGLLQQMQGRTKWHKPQPNLKVDDVVLFLEGDRRADGGWPRVRVLSVFPGADGLVRKVELKHGRHRLFRHVTALGPVLSRASVENAGLGANQDGVRANHSDEKEDGPVRDDPDGMMERDGKMERAQGAQQRRAFDTKSSRYERGYIQRKMKAMAANEKKYGRIWPPQKK